MGTFDFALCFVFFVIPTNAIYNGFNATFGASFVTTYGGLTSNFGTAGILIGSRVIVQVAHNYEVEGQPYQVFRYVIHSVETKCWGGSRNHFEVIQK